MQVDPRRNLASCIRDPGTVLLWVGETKEILNHLIGFQVQGFTAKPLCLPRALVITVFLGV